MKLKKFEIWISCIALAALAVSIVTGIYTYRTSKEANELANKAINIATKEYELSLGIISELPKVEFYRANDDIIQFFNLENIKENKFEFYIRNIGRIPIEAISIEIIAISSFLPPSDISSEIYIDFPREIFYFNLDKLLLPNGFVSFNSTKFLIKYLKNNIQFFASSNRKIRIHVNVIVIPHKKADETAIETFYYGSKDRILLEIDFNPSILKLSEINNIINNLPLDVIILPGYDE
jgi:hypothetical protein